ncbi:hypothetical protein [Solidesulfovibrio fructosivorans]|uniref:hypothetical protein n=1 Tax=Solidesulfovibrio fructosivorans TaxID=878 RepID=UPI00117C5191|nr:hypothetical protein [Solidesulfovibrio fructosivorans]
MSADWHQAVVSVVPPAVLPFPDPGDLLASIKFLPASGEWMYFRECFLGNASFPFDDLFFM